MNGSLTVLGESPVFRAGLMLLVLVAGTIVPDALAGLSVRFAPDEPWHSHPADEVTDANWFGRTFNYYEQTLLRPYFMPGTLMIGDYTSMGRAVFDPEARTIDLYNKDPLTVENFTRMTSVPVYIDGELDKSGGVMSVGRDLKVDGDITIVNLATDKLVAGKIGVAPYNCGILHLDCDGDCPSVSVDVLCDYRFTGDETIDFDAFAVAINCDGIKAPNPGFINPTSLMSLDPSNWNNCNVSDEGNCLRKSLGGSTILDLCDPDTANILGIKIESTDAFDDALITCCSTGDVLVGRDVAEQD